MVNLPPTAEHAARDKLRKTYHVLFNCECRHYRTAQEAVGELDALLAELAAAQRESESQMGSKLEAQTALMAITKALDLTLSEMGESWKDGVTHILDRIETIVDESERAFTERDEAKADLAAAQAEREEMFQQVKRRYAELSMCEHALAAAREALARQRGGQ